MQFKLKDRTGERYGLLVAISISGKDDSGHYLWLCKCDCGNTKDVLGSNLASGRVNSCGCLAMAVRETMHLTHGMTKTRLYNIWSCMIQRCEYVGSINYHLYGGRGIKVCEEWRSSFIAFKTWALKNNYKQGLTIERG